MQANHAKRNLGAVLITLFAVVLFALVWCAVIWSLTVIPSEAGRISGADAARWMRQSVTFSLIHPTCFALCAALFVSLLREEFSDLVRRRAKLFWGTLFAFAAIMTAIDVRDASRPLEPFMSKQAREAVNLEQLLRAHKEVSFEFQQAQPAAANRRQVVATKENVRDTLGADSAARVLAPDELSAIAARLRQLTAASWANANYVAVFNFVTNWVFGLLVACVATAIVALFTDAKARRIARLVPAFGARRYVPEDKFNSAWRKVAGMFVALLVWFPFRMYATWYSTSYLPSDGGLTSYPAFVLLCLAALAFGMALLLSRFDFWTVVAGVSAAVAGVIIAMHGLGVPLEVMLTSVQHMLDSGWAFYLGAFVSLGVVISALLVACLDTDLLNELHPPDGGATPRTRSRPSPG